MANQEQIQELLGRVIQVLEDPTPIFQEVGEIVVESIQKNFEDEGRPTPWQELSDTRKEQRIKNRKWPGQILAVEGIRGGLLGSIAPDPSKNQVIISANKPYATTMHYGAKKGQFGTVEVSIKEHIRKIKVKNKKDKKGKKKKKTQKITVKAHTRQQQIPWGDIPARPFMMIQDEDWLTIQDMIARRMGIS